MPDPATATDPIRRTTIGAILAILLLGFTLRVLQLDESLWLDELHTSWTVAGDWSEILSRAALGNQSPVYFWWVRGLTSTFGLHEVSLRLTSLIAGLGTILIGFALVRAGTGSNRAGLFAGLLLALDRNGIFFSQEARPYGLLQLVGWLHVFVVVRMLERPLPARRVLFVAGAVLQFYLHYTAALFVAAEVLFLIVIIVRRPQTPYRPRDLGLDLAVIVAMTIPSLTHLAQIGQRREQWELFVHPPTLAAFVTTLKLHIEVLPVVGILLAMRLLKRPHAKARSDDSSTQRRLRADRVLGIALCLLLVPPLGAWLTTQMQWAALFLNRYFVSSLAAAPIVAGLLSQRIAPAALRGTVQAVVVALALWNSHIVPTWQSEGRVIGDRRQDWRGAVTWVNERSGPDGGVCLIRSGFVEADQPFANASERMRDYLLAPVNNIYRLDIPAVPIANRIQAGGDNPFELPRVPRFWAIINGNRTTRERFLAAATRSCDIAESRTFGDVLVLECHARTSQPTSPNSITAP